MKTSAKKISKSILVGVLMCVSLGGCGFLSNDKDDLNPSKSQTVMDTGDPDEGDPDRDD
ncbi:hypothetical protein [uncultured Algoriphagus sp.]|uniref:hypothetical protein n=1 Tax=uncultured Algoriphagus sp. TaxID=417365 RepID=UPI0030ECC2C3|tara:strand:- start:15835 stop:16011 length:177 start_codon:yes stop_codon:yes gene_type:complete